MNIPVMYKDFSANSSVYFASENEEILLEQGSEGNVILSYDPDFESEIQKKIAKFPVRESQFMESPSPSWMITFDASVNILDVYNALQQ